MEFVFTGDKPVTLQMPGDYAKYTFRPTPGVQRISGNPDLESFLFSKDNPYRSLFKRPGEVKKPEPLKKKKADKPLNVEVTE